MDGGREAWKLGFICGEDQRSGKECTRQCNNEHVEGRRMS